MSNNKSTPEQMELAKKNVEEILELIQSNKDKVQILINNFSKHLLVTDSNRDGIYVVCKNKTTGNADVSLGYNPHVFRRMSDLSHLLGTGFKASNGAGVIEWKAMMVKDWAEKKMAELNGQYELMNESLTNINNQLTAAQ